MTRTAAVVGGGVGGLAAAIGLHRAGWSVEVFERAPGLPPTGTALGIWPAALRALDRIGVGEKARAIGRPQLGGAFRRPDGSSLATMDMAKLVARAGESVRLLSRPDLLGLLCDALPAGMVRFGTPVADPAALRTAYDLVVGADGLRSGVRALAFGERYRPRYAGGIAWRGVVDLPLETGGETWGRGAKFGCTPQTDGRTNWYAVRAVERGYEPPDGDMAELRRTFGAWHDPIPAILAACVPGEVLRNELCDLDPPLPSFVTGTVALVGDAAHAMTPDLGQGACQALIDGVVLAECLAGADVAAGLREYDRLRRRPTQRLVVMARRVGRISQVRRFVPVRDALIRLALVFGPPGGE